MACFVKLYKKVFKVVDINIDTNMSNVVNNDVVLPSDFPIPDATRDEVTRKITKWSKKLIEAICEKLDDDDVHKATTEQMMYYLRGHHGTRFY